MAHGVIIHLDDKCACWLYIYIYMHIMISSSKVKIGLMWASEQCYGEIMCSAQILGTRCRQLHRESQAAEGLCSSASTHVKLDDNLYQQKFVTVEDIKVSEPYADSPWCGASHTGKGQVKHLHWPPAEPQGTAS